jgi:TonB family protein
MYKNGGDLGLRKFIKENFQYPTTGENVSGKVYVGFTVDTLGNVKDIEIKRGITKSTDEEAMRIVKLLKFIPGSLNGKPIENKMIVSIDFSINYMEQEE